MKKKHQVDPEIMSGSTVAKFIRATEFAGLLERELDNTTLLRTYKEEVTEIITKRNLHKAQLNIFGEGYAHEPARLLHGMLVSVLNRFAECWDMIYDEGLRKVLSEIPKDSTNFDSIFMSRIEGHQAKKLVPQLKDMRRSYLNYMAGAAEMIHRAFIRGGLLTNATIRDPSVSDCLKPFTK